MTRFVLYGTFLDVAQMREVAMRAEELGFDGLSFPDHVVFPMSLETDYPYSKDGRPLWGPRTEWPDPFVAITAMAACTTRLRFITGVLVLPLRHPLLTAKAAATVSALSGGRIDLGVGVGWMREEFEALDLDFAKRGRRTDESIEIMRLAWSGEPVSYEGSQFSFGPLTSHPAPPSPPRILIGGGSEAAIDRAARLGDGFLPPLGTAARTAELAAELAERRRALGRAELPFELVASGFGISDVDEVEALAEAGATAIHADVFSLYRLGRDASLDQRIEALERYSQDMIEPLRARGRKGDDRWT